MAITYFGSASSPADNGIDSGTDTETITPPASMLAGDLVFVACQYKGAVTMTVGNAGGQTWNTIGEISAANVDVQVFWCRFDGTWSANPSFVASVGGSGAGLTAVMHVFRPSLTVNQWVVDVTRVETDFGATATWTQTGITTLHDQAVVIALWASTDDNTWGTLTGGWTIAGSNQYRNTRGVGQSMAMAYKIMAAGASGNVALTQATNGPDAGTALILSFAETVNFDYSLNDIISNAPSASASYDASAHLEFLDNPDDSDPPGLVLVSPAEGLIPGTRAVAAAVPVVIQASDDGIGGGVILAEVTVLYAGRDEVLAYRGIFSGGVWSDSFFGRYGEPPSSAVRTNLLWSVTLAELGGWQDAFGVRVLLVDGTGNVVTEDYLFSLPPYAVVVALTPAARSVPAGARALALDPTTGDLVVGQTLQFVVDGPALVQAVKLRLSFFLGEWFADQTKGLPYYESVFVANPDLVAIREIFRSQIAGVAGVLEVISLNVQFDRAARTFSLSFVFDSDFGEFSVQNFVPPIGQEAA